LDFVDHRTQVLIELVLHSAPACTRPMSSAHKDWPVQRAGRARRHICVPGGPTIARIFFVLDHLDPGRIEQHGLDFGEPRRLRTALRPEKMTA